MIDFVVIDGQRASIGEHAGLFPGYFGIDSVSLMLGKNGSGKTRLLQSLAEVLTAGAPLSDQGNWQIHDSQGKVFCGDARQPPPGVGVVYFTPLKYQRNIGTHRRFVNASNLKADTLKQSMLSNFSDIALSLGVSTQLTASLSYNPNIFERLVIPSLFEMRKDIAHSEARDESEVSLEISRFLLQADERAPSATGSFMRISANYIQASIERELDRRGPFYRIAALATLENLSRNLKDRLYVTASFLRTLGLISFLPSKVVSPSKLDRISGRFNEALDTSLKIATSSRVQSNRQTSSHFGIQFEINDVHHLTYLEQIGSSFQLSWSNLSSGLLSLVDQFARLDVALSRLHSRSVSSALVLIDEGDSCLHLDWQRQYVERIDQFLTEAKKRHGFQEVQAVIATHSPIISGDFPSPLVQRLGSEMPVGTKTFGSSLDALVLDTFGTPSIGSKAAHQVQRLRKAVLSQTLTGADLNLIDEIGDERLKRAVLAAPKGSE